MDRLKLNIQDIRDIAAFLVGLQNFLNLHAVTANGVLRIAQDPESGVPKAAIQIINNTSVLYDYQRVRLREEEEKQNEHDNLE
ncbi:MAG: hypothetical protein XU14_C0033G0032 [Armatimonadetes bacterium CSP1-3]|nr:MAG: hypothetical protein XU14_C0033G0032 [Armatimonadetes bacterium CSP1-3]